MKRILPVVVGVFVLGFAALLVGPSFIDWNKYKPQIIAQAKSAAGYDIAIDGDIGLAILPSPHLTLDGLTVAAPRGTEKNLLTMKEAEVSVSLLPLLSGNIQIDTVRFVNPDIRLQKLADGTNSWLSDMLVEKQKAEATGTEVTPKTTHNGTDAIALHQIIIEGGRVSYMDVVSQKSQIAEDINLNLKADTLAGPFDAKGDFSYNKQKIEISAETERLDLDNASDKKEIPVDATIRLVDAKASADFKGVVAYEPAFELQGKMNLTADDLAAALAVGGGEKNAALSQKLSFSGLVTANEDRLQSEELDITFGDTKGKGNIVVSGLKEKNPVTAQADMAFQGIIDLDKLGAATPAGETKSVEEKVARGEKLSPAKGLIPATMTMPFPLNAAVRISAEGIKMQGQTIKGVTLDARKESSAFDVTVKAADMPGKTTASGTGALRYTAATNTADGVTYADPSLAFKINGTSQQLPSLLRAYMPDQKSDALEIWKTAKFDVAGTVTPSSAKVTSGALDLDQSAFVFTGAYEPKGAGGRPSVALDVTTDLIDVDQIQSRLNGGKKQAVQKDPTKKADVKKALEPVRAFDVPVNLTFDVSAQKAVYDGKTISGIRAKGRAAGKTLNLEVASAQDYLGAAASLSGVVQDMEKLSGIDLKLYGRTADVRGLMQALKMDASKLPQKIGAAEANIAAKGVADNLAFDARVNALDGQAEAKGTMTGLLDTPSFSNLSVGASHPNFINAMRIFNPAFVGGPGLSKPFSFYTDAVKEGETYNLTNLKANLGGTSLGGALKVDMAGAKPSVAGTIDAGAIPLDEFLGAKEQGGGSGGGGGASASSAGGKWSRDPIQTEWMHSAELDLSLSAQSINYGGWNFQKPKTKIALKGGNLTVDDLNAGLFGGTATLTAKVQDPTDPKQPLALAINTKMDKVDLAPLVTALSGTRRVQATGDVSLDMNVQGSGLSPYALVSALQGKANLNGNSVVMKGFDLAQIGLAFVDTGKPLDRLSSLVGGAVAGGETRFDTIKGAYDIAQGIATITAMEMDGPAANIKSRGNVNLPRWTIDTIHTITFKQAKDAGAFDVKIQGPLDSAANTFGRGLFNDVLTRRLQQKAVEKLPDVLGKDLTGKLQGLGILPQQQQQQQPAQEKPASIPDMPPENAPTEPQSQNMAPAQEELPAQEVAPVEKTPEEQLRDQAGQALQGVLNGLGR